MARSLTINEKNEKSRTRPSLGMMSNITQNSKIFMKTVVLTELSVQKRLTHSAFCNFIAIMSNHKIQRC